MESIASATVCPSPPSSLCHAVTSQKLYNNLTVNILEAIANGSLPRYDR